MVLVAADSEAFGEAVADGCMSGRTPYKIRSKTDDFVCLWKGPVVDRREQPLLSIREFSPINLNLAAINLNC